MSLYVINTVSSEVFSFFLVSQALDLDESFCCADLNSLPFIRSSSSDKEMNRLF